MLEKKFADVVFPLPLPQAFTYAVPPDLAQHLQIGSRVIAPFGARKLTGFVVGLKAESDRQDVRDIQDCLDAEPVLSEEQLAIANWIADYYLCSLGEAIKTILPASLVLKSSQYVECSSPHAEMYAQEISATAPRQAQILRYVAKSKRISVDNLKKRLGASSLVASLRQLEGKGLVTVQQRFGGSSPKAKTEKYVRLNHETVTAATFATIHAKLKKGAPRQAACLHYLKQQGREVRQKELLQKTGAALAAVRGLLAKRLVTLDEKTVLRDYYQTSDIEAAVPLTLTREQQAACADIEQALDRQAFRTFLLFGVTGSGKTQVYIEAIYRALKQNRTAIVLVPEISLTPQTVSRFRSHFGDKVAVLHSAMSTGERFDSWQRLSRGEAVVAIGPRSAIFAPLRRIGLIIVDEEHEGSYKQSDSVRYHARDVAVVRGKFNDAVVILGSATPSAESFYNARTGKYKLLELKKRVHDVALPAVRIIDMLKEKRMSGTGEVPIFSRLLVQKIEEKIHRNEQIILLLNRRGFSSFIKCQDCGHVEECHQCNITMTYHLHGRRLRCHYCGDSRRAPAACPSCQGADIVFTGHGTQKVQYALEQTFPDVNVVRMDLDTTSKKWSHDRILKDFERGKYHILLGTQMVAKGLDFNRVTLVGVINADVGLLIPDFRSTERTFQLLTQVAGRAGRRSITGEVIIQTFTPDSFCLRCAREHDFVKFYLEEISQRHELGYPPFGRLISIVFRGEREGVVKRVAQDYARLLAGKKHPFQVLGPVPSPIARIQNKFRYQILLKSAKSRDNAGREVRRAAHRALLQCKQMPSARDVHIAVDVDPVSII